VLEKYYILSFYFIITSYLLQAKGYRVGPVYDDVLAMSWFFLELIVKSMALEQSCLFYHNLPLGIFHVDGAFVLFCFCLLLSPLN